MPTPTRLPKPGEIWQRRLKLPPDWKLETLDVEIIERMSGSYWAVRVKLPDRKVQLWVDASWWASKGDFVFLRRADVID